MKIKNKVNKCLHFGADKVILYMIRENRKHEGEYT